MDRMRLVLLFGASLICSLAFAVQGVSAADCFAIDPVFIQADRRVVPALADVTKAAAEPAQVAEAQPALVSDSGSVSAEPTALAVTGKSLPTASASVSPWAWAALCVLLGSFAALAAAALLPAAPTADSARVGG
jgi:hypothetical protein